MVLDAWPSARSPRAAFISICPEKRWEGGKPPTRWASFKQRADSPAGQIVKLADLLAPLGPGFVVSDDAVADFAVRPREAEWARFVAACNLLRAYRAESA